MNKRYLYAFVLALFLVALLAMSQPAHQAAGKALAQGSSPAVPGEALGSGFTYQGQLKDSAGDPITSTCDFTFSLWDSLSGSTGQLGDNSIVTGVSVAGGYFAALVNAGGEFGIVFTGEARWLQIAVKCTGDAGYTTLSPRQPLSATPYAIGLKPGAYVEGVGTSNEAIFSAANYQTAYSYGLYGSSISTQGIGIYGEASATSGPTTGVLGSVASFDGAGVRGTGTRYGVYGEATMSTGGTAGVFGVCASASGSGVLGIASATVGYNFGVAGQSDSSNGTGVTGYANATSGVNMGVFGGSNSPDGYGVFGLAASQSGTTSGVWGSSASSNGRGVYGTASAVSGTTSGVWGSATSPNGRGVYGTGGYIGVYGTSSATSGRGVFGEAASTIGVTYGVFGTSASTAGYGVYGGNNSASGVAIMAGGTGIIQSAADTVLYLSPHAMVLRGSTGLTLTPLDNGGIGIHKDTVGTDTKYLSIPVSTYGTLFGARQYVKSIQVCYKTPAYNNYIDATEVLKNDGGLGYAFYIHDPTDRTASVFDCYTVTAGTPRVAIDNSSWVQFNLVFENAAGWEIDIYTVKLTLTEYQN
jgi:hypothetical protein